MRRLNRSDVGNCAFMRKEENPPSGWVFLSLAFWLAAGRSPAYAPRSSLVRRRNALLIRRSRVDSPYQRIAWTGVFVRQYLFYPQDAPLMELRNYLIRNDKLKLLTVDGI